MQGIINLSNTALVASTAALTNISNNLANMNTVGYRGTRTSFGSLFDAGTQSSGGSVSGGVTANTSTLNMRAGSYTTTGNNLDLAVLGAGFFVLRDDAGHLSYTRNGQFSMKDNKLVASNGDAVQAYGPGGALADVTVGDLLLSSGKATTAITFGGVGLNVLKSDKPVAYTKNVDVYDASGGKHALSLVFTPSTPTPPDPAVSIQWTVTVEEAGKSIGSPLTPFVLKFGPDGKPLKGGESFTFDYVPPGLSPVPVKVDCSAILSLSSGTTALTPIVDGRAGGALQTADLSFDSSGVLQLLYDNGEAVQGPTLALATIQDAGDWKEVGSGRFEPVSAGAIQLGTAGGQFGTISSRQVEGSNVDMSTEFSDMILAQRMYQSASQVIQATNTLSDALLRAAGGR